MQIGIVEDDEHQAQYMALWLASAGHTCKRYTSGERFIEALQREDFDLLIVDWMLPDINGDEILLWVRENLGWHIPILFVTARVEEGGAVKMLNSGADDYMTKPLKHMEMLARVEALGRRSDIGHAKARLCFGRYEVDPQGRKILNNGVEVELTQKEYALALFLLKNAGQLLSRDQLLENIWGRNAEVETRTVDTHISRIRKKLRLTPENGWRLTPVYGCGYRLDPVEGEQTDGR